MKRALSNIDAALRGGDFTHVYCSDAKSYDASIRIMNQVLTALDLRQHPDKTWISRIDQEGDHDATLKTFDFLGMAFSRDGLCALVGTTPDRVREMTSQVYDRTVREVPQGTRQAGTLRPSQAEFLRRVETYRKNWQRYLKGIIAGFHPHRGVEATAALYAQLCEQHRQLSSPLQWVKHFPQPRWQVGITKRTIDTQNNETEKKYYRLGGRRLLPAGC